MGAIIGIDLGTTTSEISYLKDGKPQLIKNKSGESFTFSVVGVSESGEILVGNPAKKQLILKPEYTIAEVKRLMGRDVKINLGKFSYLPQDISAMILKYLKECAEACLNEEVTEAVITVPAKFNNLQRQATKDAAAIAGLKVERIINEPTAAALAYGIENYDSEETILVYDLGGGTFDVTVLEMFDGILDVKASRGNNELGGKDFDERIMEYVFEAIKEQHGLNLRKDLRARAAIKVAAEKAKINLSYSDTVTMNIPLMTPYENGILMNFQMEITRQQYELLIADLMNQTNRIVDEALKACGLKAEDVDLVIPVGGSTRNLCVRKYLENKFEGRVKSEINPEEVVALGAAVQAGIKSGKLNKDSDILITDVCPYSLGVEICERLGINRDVTGVFSPIIKIDTTIPATKAQYYSTAVDNQTTIRLNIYQGEEILVLNNKKIGELVLENIPAGLAGKEIIKVEFSYDLNGILDVGAEVLSTGRQASLVINTKSMSESDLSSSRDNLDRKWRKS